MRIQLTVHSLKVFFLLLEHLIFCLGLFQLDITLVIICRGSRHLIIGRISRHPWVNPVDVIYYFTSN